jgi:hypothetical protein
MVPISRTNICFYNYKFMYINFKKYKNANFPKKSSLDIEIYDFYRPTPGLPEETSYPIPKPVSGFQKRTVLAPRAIEWANKSCFYNGGKACGAKANIEYFF